MDINNEKAHNNLIYNKNRQTKKIKSFQNDLLFVDKTKNMLYHNKALTKASKGIAGWSSLVARRAHNPKVRRFKSPPRNQKK